MSKAANFITISTVIGTHDQQDAAKLGHFLLAFSRTNLGELGVHGDAKLVFKGNRYLLVFDGGATLGLPDKSLVLPTDSLSRVFVCGLDGCTTQIWVDDAKNPFCAKHRAEELCEV